MRFLPGLPSSEDARGPLDQLMSGLFMWQYHNLNADGTHSDEEEEMSFSQLWEEETGHRGLFRYTPTAKGYLDLGESEWALLLDHRSEAQLRGHHAGLPNNAIQHLESGHRLIRTAHARECGFEPVESIADLLAIPKHPASLLDACFGRTDQDTGGAWEGWRSDWLDLDQTELRIPTRAQDLRRKPPRGHGWDGNRGRPLQVANHDHSVVHRFHLERLVREEGQEDVGYGAPFDVAFRLHRQTWRDGASIKPDSVAQLFWPSDKMRVARPFQARHDSLPKSDSLVHFQRFDTLRHVLRAFLATADVLGRCGSAPVHLLPRSLKSLLDQGKVHREIRDVSHSAARALNAHVRERTWLTMD